MSEDYKTQLTNAQKDHSEHLARMYHITGNGREMIEKTYRDGYLTGAIYERENHSSMTRRDYKIRRFFDFVSAGTFVLFLIFCFGQLPIEKAIESVTTKYQKEAEFKAKQAVCGRIAIQAEPYASHFEDAFVAGCLWTSKMCLLDRYSKDPQAKTVIENLFADPDSSDMLDFKNRCSAGAADQMVKGVYQERVVQDLWTSMECGGDAPKDGE